MQAWPRLSAACHKTVTVLSTWDGHTEHSYHCCLLLVDRYAPMPKPKLKVVLQNVDEAKAFLEVGK